jgi:hypothetical protein
MDFSKLYEYGLLGVMLGLVLFALWKIIVWLMAFIKEDRERQAVEREKWLCRLEKLDESIRKTADNIDNHDKRAEERGRYVKEEHAKTISQGEIICSSLKQVEQALGRINGYTKT